MQMSSYSMRQLPIEVQTLVHMYFISSDVIKYRQENKNDIISGHLQIQ